jgi:DNA-binding NtrC family response regulator
VRWRIVATGDRETAIECGRLLDHCELTWLDWRALRQAGVDECTADLILSISADADGARTEWLSWLRTNTPPLPILALVPAHADETLQRFAREFATDFAIWPASREELAQRVARMLGDAPSEADALHDRLTREVALRQLVGRDPAFLRVIGQIPLFAKSNRPVLITGETGTGKELCARALHHLGRRRDFPFIPIDCGAFPDHLFENEMFGHERGAFTDAHRRQRGLIAMAEGGTLFLDEIDSLSPAAQAKLLRFLQEHVYRPLGSDQFVHADVNVITASNGDLETLVTDKTFRSDLFFRLSVLRLHMMPLRERLNDIPVLAKHFLDHMCAEEGLPRKTLAPIAQALLREMPWPGNVRELYNVVQRAFVFATGPQVLASHVTAARSGLAQPPPPAAATAVDVGFRKARARAIAAFECQYVIEMLRANNGNITQAARGAQQDRRAFGRLVKRHNIDRRAI